MFTDPQTITIAPAAALPLPRTSTDGTESVYRSADGTVVLRARHFYNKRVRDEVRVQVSKTVPDPTQPALNREVGGTVMVSFDFSNTGYTAADKKAIYDGLVAQLGASSSAVLVKLLGGES